MRTDLAQGVWTRANRHGHSPWRLFSLLDAFWMLKPHSLRAAASLLEVGDSRLQWLLPASKCDPVGLGLERSDGFVEAELAEQLPVHILRVPLSLHRGFAVGGVLPHSLPLWPVLSGRCASKASVEDDEAHC
eukprot:3629018-Amphidinium_carterae.1